MVDDMRNVLFPSGQHGGLDLASMNIQRGRDHGLPDYNTVRKAFGLKGITSFADITNHTKIARKFEDLYQDRNNVDLWVAGLAEEHEHGSELGATFRTIVMRNFLRIRNGDRFWYERYLSEEEIDKVHSLTLGKIIRLNTGYKSAPDNVFFSAEYCAGVENFQCVPYNKTPSGSCENMQRKLRTLQQDLEKSKQACDAKRSKTDAAASTDAVDTVLIVLCVLFFLLAVLFLFLFLRVWLLLRRSLLDNVKAQKEFGLELRNNSKKESEIYQNAFGDFIMSREG